MGFLSGFSKGGFVENYGHSVPAQNQGSVLANFLYDMDFQVGSYKKWTLSKAYYVLLANKLVEPYNSNFQIIQNTIRL